MNRKWLGFKTLKSKTLIIVLLLQFPLAAFSVVITDSVVRSLNRRTVDSIVSSIRVQMNRLELTMLNTSALIKTFYTDSYMSPPNMETSEWYFFYTSLQKTLNTFEYSTSENRLQRYFIYDRKNQYFLKSGVSSILHPDEQNDLFAYFKELKPFVTNTWLPVKLGGNNFILYLIQNEHFIIGACMDCNDIHTFLTASLPKDTYLFLCDNQKYLLAGENLPEVLDVFTTEASVEFTRSIGGEQYLFTESNSLYGLKVLTAIFLPGLFSSPGLNNFVWLLFPLYAVVVIPILLWFLYHQFVTPLNYLQFGFSQIADNDLVYRAREDLFSLEFQYINRSFNAMVRQIHDLKLEYYEQKIKRQKNENFYLRSIMYPHFMLNNLNLINNFAYQGNEEGIHTAVMNLSKYLRYTLTPRSIDHRVINDIESIRSYLNLNQLAYPGRINYTLDYDEEILQLKLQPLLLCTVVENCIKHGLTPEKTLKINISCKLGQWEGDKALIYSVSNSGSYYPAAVIHDINSRNNFSQQKDQRIGLNSIKNMLFYTYGENADIILNNNTDVGALTTIRIKFSAILKKSQEFELNEHYSD